MFTERIQVLMTRAQRRRLEHEARRRGTSVGALIRESLEAQAGRPTLDARRDAAREIAAMRGAYVPLDEMEHIVDEEREEWVARLAPERRRR